MAPSSQATYETLTFEQWMKAVDRECVGIAGVSVHDLADQCFRDWYDSGVCAYEAAIWTLEDEGFPFEDAPDLFLE